MCFFFFVHLRVEIAGWQETTDCVCILCSPGAGRGHLVPAPFAQGAHASAAASASNNKSTQRDTSILFSLTNPTQEMLSLLMSESIIEKMNEEGGRGRDVSTLRRSWRLTSFIHSFIRKRFNK